MKIVLPMKTTVTDQAVTITITNKSGTFLISIRGNVLSVKRATLAGMKTVFTVDLGKES